MAKIYVNPKLLTKAKRNDLRSIRRQVKQIQDNAKKILTQDIPFQVERSLFAVGVAVSNKSLEYAPVEYSLLQNSNYHIVEATEKGYHVKVGYTSNYAAPLHDRTDWSPRPPDQKAGPAWNPRAKPRFLYSAAEEEMTTITRIMLGDLEL